MERSRKLMVVASGLMFVSQFMNWLGPYSKVIGYIPTQVSSVQAPDGNYAASAMQPGVTGWAFHPVVIIFLIALGLMFLAGFQASGAVKRWWYWIGVALLVLCFYPFDFEMAPPGMGAGVAALAVAIGIWAAFSNRTPQTA